MALPPCRAGADTVHLKNNTELKGIVIADFKDRITYSTVGGERQILKSDIKSIEYDETIDNLISLGDAHYQEGRYKAALKYYLKAQKINRDIRSLNERIYHTEIIVSNTPGLIKVEYFNMKNEIVSGNAGADGTGGSALTGPRNNAELEKSLRAGLGITVTQSAGRFYVKNTSMRSNFRKAGIRAGDALISAWSIMCDYLTLEELHDLLLGPEEATISLTTERKVKFRKGLPFDATLVMKWEGATVESVKDGSAAKKAGLRDRDLIVALDNRSVVYTPLKKVLATIKKRKKAITITVRRKLIVIK